MNEKIKYKSLIIFGFLSLLYSEEPLTVGFWNVENLFDLENNPDKNDDEFSIGGRKNVDQEIYDLKLKHCSEVISDLNVDVLGLCEVENLVVLNDLNIAYPDRDYRIIHYESPDNRGIDNALLYDPDRFSIISSKPILNKLKNGGATRDILYVEGKYQDRRLHLFVNHWPSNYGGREKSIPKRRSTAELIIKEIEMLQKSDEFAEIILLGDFNENPDEQNIKLLEKIGLTSLMKPMIGKSNIGTYVYRGKDYLYDQIIVNDQLQDAKNLVVVNDSVYILDLPKYRQQEGSYKHYPFRFWAGNRLLGGYSDHLAIKVKIINN
ncbi:MAG: endonuclease/exonuclease/phosphatase family protein [bacterium TMED46]|nr:MAG: endonuclease/exonuclease/phosphatase family protein [bacterium TMED46]|tara:strand:- start:5111 stop:6073 length:963 start_codon:yes stop_codon:yes gene_type:complete